MHNRGAVEIKTAKKKSRHKILLFEKSKTSLLIQQLLFSKIRLFSGCDVFAISYASISTNVHLSIIESKKANLGFLRKKNTTRKLFFF